MRSDYRRFAALRIGSAVVILSGFSALRADTIIVPDLAGFVLTNNTADGSVGVNSPASFVLTGGNTGSGLSGTTTFTGTAMASGLVEFQWSYASLDSPGFDNAGYIAGIDSVQLADTDGESGQSRFNVTSGETYGWFADTFDNTGEPGILTVTLLDSAPGAETPEPRFSVVILILLGALAAITTRKKIRLAAPLFACIAASLHGQTQNHYTGSSITGQLTLTNVVNPSQIMASQAAVAMSETRRYGADRVAAIRRPGQLSPGPELPFARMAPGRPLTFSRAIGGGAALAFRSLSTADASASQTHPSGFNGLSHYDQRMADSGNQLSTEPPSPSLATANGFVLEGVNNAVRVFNKSGQPLIPALSSNQWFGLASEYDRTTGISGPFPTDMRVYYDSDINRWFVLQRAQDNDIYGDVLNSSHIYMAVSATGDPTGKWNVYTFNSTNANNPGCPCFPDYLQVGSDQYGFYISADEYDTTYLQPVDSVIMAISKTALGAAASAPTAVLFQIPFTTGYEFAIHPAATPPGASKFLASGGVEYFASSQAFFSEDSRIGLWSLSNTASLGGQSPALLLTQTSVPTEWYYFPGVASQKSGSIPYGASLTPPGQLEFLDGNSDSRVQSVSYSGGRLFVTLPTQLIDAAGNSVVGGAYMILSPTFRSNTVNATMLEQGYLSVVGNHILRPAIAVNSQGAGAITFTLAGPDYYPSAAFVTFDLLSSPSSVQIAAAGVGPDDGFTGYTPSITAPVARWGDYSTAAADTDGSIWMVTEDIPGGLRTVAANWGTYISHYVP